MMSSSATENPSFDITVVYNNDARLWPDHIRKQLTPSYRFRSVLDTDVRSTTPPISDSKVVVAVASIGLIELLTSKDQASSSFFENVAADGGLIFMCGIEDEDFYTNVNAEQPCKTACEHFPQFTLWTRVIYTISGANLKKTIDRLVAAWTPSKVQLHPTTVHSEDPSAVVLSFTDVIKQTEAAIEVNISDEDGIFASTKATRLNPYTYTFTAPEHRAGTSWVQVTVNGETFGRHMALEYQLSTSATVNDVGQIYMHLLNTLCTRILGDPAVPQMRQQPTKTDMDMKLSSLFDLDDTAVGIPANAFEQLFGVYRYSSSEDTHTCELPTLLHLAAKFGLQELCARLTDLPDSNEAFVITNSSGQMPSDIARKNGHQELADFLDTFHETSDFGLYVVGDENVYYSGSRKPRYVNCQMVCEIEDSIYLPMDRSTAARNNRIIPSLYPQQPVYCEFPEDQTGNLDINMPKSQQDLVEIMNLVKTGQLNMARAESLFRNWQMQQDGGPSKSFKDRVAKLQNMKRSIQNAKTQSDRVRETANNSAETTKQPPMRSDSAGPAVPKRPQETGKRRSRDSGYGRSSRTNSLLSTGEGDAPAACLPPLPPRSMPDPKPGLPPRNR